MGTDRLNVLFHQNQDFNHLIRFQVNSVSFSFDGERCLAASEDDSISLFNVQDGTLKRKFYSKKYGVENLCFTKNRENCVYSSNKVNDDIRYQEQGFLFNFSKLYRGFGTFVKRQLSYLKAY